MFDIFISKLLQLLIEWKYIGLFLSSLGILPTEVIAVVLANTHKANIWMISFVSSLGGLIGGYLTYLLGYIFTEESFYNWIEGKGKFLRIKRKDVEKSKKEILKRSFWYMFFSRFVPWLRIAASVAGGFLRINIWLYSVAVFIGGFLYMYVVTYVGSHIDGDLLSLKKYIGALDRWLILLTVVYLIFSLLLKNKILVRKIFSKFKKE